MYECTVEKWLFPRWSGYSIQVKWSNVQAIDVTFSQNLTHQKSLKSVNFWQSYLENQKVDVFWDTVYIIAHNAILYHW